MDIEDFIDEIERCWERCPANIASEKFLDEFGLNRSMQAAFMLGAGVGLVVCKAKGVDRLTKQDVASYVYNKRIEDLFTPNN